jgi:hypothetical protein
MCRGHQSLYHATLFQMAVDDFIYVALIHIGVPHTFRVNHGHRAAGAAV